jgi:hypothetical protein
VVAVLHDRWQKYRQYGRYWVNSVHGSKVAEYALRYNNYREYCHSDYNGSAATAALERYAATARSSVQKGSAAGPTRQTAATCYTSGWQSTTAYHS